MRRVAYFFFFFFLIKPNEERQAGEQTEGEMRREGAARLGRPSGTWARALRPGRGCFPPAGPERILFGLDLDRQPMSREHFRFRTPQPRDGPSKSAAAAGEPPRAGGAPSQPPGAPLRRSRSARAPLRLHPRLQAACAASLTHRLAPPAPRAGTDAASFLSPITPRFFGSHPPPGADALQTFPAPPRCTTPLPWPVRVLHGYSSISAQRLSSERTRALLS